MFEILEDGALLLVRRNGTTAALIDRFNNPLHTQNCYLNIKELISDPTDDSILFREIRRFLGRPLQIMLDSDHPLYSRILSSGFRCVRKCYELEVGPDAYHGPILSADLCSAVRGDMAFHDCCELLYKHYCSAHASINPLSADVALFKTYLPDHVVYQTDSRKITQLAFLESNEIAYVYSADLSGFEQFICVVINRLFQLYQTIRFESDHTDAPATMLRNLFSAQSSISYDTLLYP